MDEKEKEIQSLIDSINKTLGADSLMRLGEAPKPQETISTGILPLDVALDIGGLPKGRIIEIYGHNSSGKTTICQYVIASAQAEGGLCAFIDMEHALDPAYAKLCGVDTENLMLSQPDSGEEALELAEALVRSGKVSVIVIDSVSALVPKKELEGDMGDASVGLQARLMSQALRKLSGVVKKTDTILIFTNQIRQKIGVLYGSPDTTSGGLALSFYASVRMEVRRGPSITAQKEVVGNLVRVKITKNKVGRPFRQAEFNLIYGKGIDKIGAMFDVAVHFDIIQRKGAYYYLYGEQMGQGKDASLEFLTKDEALLTRVREMVLEKAQNMGFELDEEETEE